MQRRAALLLVLSLAGGAALNAGYF